MELNPEDDQLLDSYLKEELPQVAREKLQKRLAQEPVLAEALSMRQLISKGVKPLGRQHLKKLFQEADKELDASTNSTSINLLQSSKPSLFPWLAAASIAILLGLAIWWTLDSSTPNRLYLAHYEPFPNLIAPIDKGGSNEDVLAEAVQAYERADYATATQKFELLEPIEKDARIYYGLTLLQSNQMKEAITELTLVASDKDNRFQQAGEWYLVLAYLKNKEVAAAKIAHQKILATPNHRYFGKAKELVLD